jgi:signal peptidase I
MIRFRRFVVIGLTVLVGVLAAFMVRTFAFESFYVPSGSMIPTIKIGDRILVDKLSYDFGKVGFGNIIVFRRPADDPAPSNVHYLVKRVIGLPGETIWSKHGQVYINGHMIQEPFLPPGDLTRGIPPTKLGPNEYYVLGDNRPDSEDSRYFGPISGNLIVGKVVLIYWPPSAWRLF